MAQESARDRQAVPFEDTRPLATHVGEHDPRDTGTPAQAESRALLLQRLPQPGNIVAEKYRIEQCLGVGGMGAVFCAVHLVTDKRVAIKWMLPSDDEQAHRRFVREARAAGRINHPNVVDVYDIGVQDNCGYLVMELMHGESLRKRLTRGPLGVAEAVSLLLPAMRGVSAVHRAQVIHRDLKPDNIFLCESAHEGRFEAKVLDFGISAMVSSSATDSRLTADGAVLGTPAYMSPEQLRDAGDVDPRSDVYAFGVILYEALTGRLPLRADSYSALVLAIVQDTPPHPSSVQPSIPRAAGDIVLRALAKSREQRWPDIEALMAALSPFALTQPGSEPPQPRAGAMGTRRMRAVMLAGCLGCLGLLAYLLLHGQAASLPAAGQGNLVRPRLTEQTPLAPPAAQPAVAQPVTQAVELDRAPRAEPAQTPSDARAPAAENGARPSHPPPRRPNGAVHKPQTAPGERPESHNARSGHIALDEL